MVVSIGACILVEGFLDGGPRDYIVLLLAAVSLLIRFLEKKIERFQKYAKYAYMTFPIWGACVLVISNDGKFAGATQIYFMWLLLAVAYCDERMVLLCSSLTILSTACAIVLFPGAMLQLDNIITWFYIFVAYVMESILAVIIANRIRNSLLRTQHAQCNCSGSGVPDIKSYWLISGCFVYCSGNICSDYYSGRYSWYCFSQEKFEAGTIIRFV